MGAIKDPLFGIRFVTKDSVFPELKGTPEGLEEISFNKGHDDFIRAIIDKDRPIVPIHDDILRQQALRTLHDSCFGIITDGFNIGEEYHQNHESLRYMAMKPAYDIRSEGSVFEMSIEDFVMGDVHKYTGMTLADWLNTTRTRQDIIRKAIERKKKLEIQTNESLVNSIENAEKSANK